MKTPIVIPTVTAESVEEYSRQLDLVLSLTNDKAHLDLSDGIFSPVKMVDVEHAYVPGGVRPDVHLMLQEVMPKLHTVIALDPRVVTIHAESDDCDEALTFLHEHGVRTSLGILPDTTVESQSARIQQIDEVMIFGGRLGYKGGSIDLTQTAKIQQIKAIKPDVNVAWDGGINQDNITELRKSGVEIFYIGSGISKAEEPSAAYYKIHELLNQYSLTNLKDVIK